jgi:hypothetical protein
MHKKKRRRRKDSAGSDDTASMMTCIVCMIVEFPAGEDGNNGATLQSLKFPGLIFLFAF